MPYFLHSKEAHVSHLTDKSLEALLAAKSEEADMIVPIERRPS